MLYTPPRLSMILGREAKGCYGTVSTMQWRRFNRQQAFLTGSTIIFITNSQKKKKDMTAVSGTELVNSRKTYDDEMNF